MDAMVRYSLLLLVRYHLAIMALVKYCILTSRSRGNIAVECRV